MHQGTRGARVTTAQEAAREILRQYRERILKRSAEVGTLNQRMEAMLNRIDEIAWSEEKRRTSDAEEDDQDKKLVTRVVDDWPWSEMERGAAELEDLLDARTAEEGIKESQERGTVSLTEFKKGLEERETDAALKESPFYIYIAGPLSDFPAQYLSHATRMSREARWCMEQGWVPFNPAADLIEGLMSVKPMPDLMYHKRSMDMLRLIARAEKRAIYVVGDRHYNGALSGGVFKEMVEAKHLGIPICRSRDELIAMQDFYLDGTEGDIHG